MYVYIALLCVRFLMSLASIRRTWWWDVQHIHSEWRRPHSWQCSQTHHYERVSASELHKCVPTTAVESWRCGLSSPDWVRVGTICFPINWIMVQSCWWCSERLYPLLNTIFRINVVFFSLQSSYIFLWLYRSTSVRTPHFSTDSDSWWVCFM